MDFIASCDPFQVQIRVHRHHWGAVSARSKLYSQVSVGHRSG